MSAAKKILNKFTLGVVIFLIVCTFLSKSIAEAIKPEVEAVNPVRMSLTVEDKTMRYNLVVPYMAIIHGAEDRTYVYVIRERQGLFGVDYYIKEVEVRVTIDDNFLYAAIDGRIINPDDDIALTWPGYYFMPGETVKVINR